MQCVLPHGPSVTHVPPPAGLESCFLSNWHRGGEVLIVGPVLVCLGLQGYDGFLLANLLNISVST